jgi:hypothetical protein
MVVCILELPLRLLDIGRLLTRLRDEPVGRAQRFEYLLFDVVVELAGADRGARRAVA